LPKQPCAQDFCSPDISNIDIPFADAENGHRSLLHNTHSDMFTAHVQLAIY